MAFTQGNNDNNQLPGTAEADIILAFDGKDDLEGRDGNDFLYGNQGGDGLLGQEGNDYLDGGEGDDLMAGGNGSDTLVAGQGDDFASGGEGNDFIYGFDGSDVLGGGGSSDYMDGGSGEDFLGGGDGVDTLLGGLGDDILVGGKGNDSMFGGFGADVFAFGQVADVEVVVDSGERSGSLISNGVNPYDPALGLDTINDFVRGQDLINLGEMVGSPGEIAFVTNDGAASTSNGIVVYSRATGNLFYNPNGSGAELGTNGSQFATVLGAPSLTNDDFSLGLV